MERRLNVENANELLSGEPYHLVLMSYPLYSIPTLELIEKIRSPSCPSRDAAIMVMAHAGKREEAEEKLGSVAKSILTMEDDPAAVAEAVSRIIRGSDRVPSRIMIRLQLLGEGRTIPLLCRTGNLSASGMFVSTDSGVDPGEELDFHFMLPWDHEPISGRCRVVRRAHEESGIQSGLGLMFLTFVGDGQERLMAYLGKKS